MRQAQLIQRIIGLRTCQPLAILRPRRHSQLFQTAEKQDHHSKATPSSTASSSLVNAETAQHSSLYGHSFEGQVSAGQNARNTDFQLQLDEFGLLRSAHQPSPTTKVAQSIEPNDDLAVFDPSSCSSKLDNFLDEKLSTFAPEVIQLAEQITSANDPPTHMIKNKKRSIDKMYMSIQFQQIILPYLHACVNCGLTDRAFTTINWYNFKNKMFDNCDPQLILNISNILLKGYAIQNRLSGTKEVLKLLRHFDIQPDLQSYAWHLYILAKNDRTHLASKILNEMRERRLNVEELFQKSSLNNDQRYVIRQFIKKVDSTVDFLPPSIAPEPDLEIIRKLDETPKAKYLPLDQLDEWNADQAWAEQIGMEREGRVRLQSVYQTKPTKQMQFCRQHVQRLENEWRAVILAELESSLEMMKNKYSEFNGMNLYPYLCTLDLKSVANLMVDEAMALGRMNGTYSPPSHLNYLNLGKKIQNHYITRVTLQTFPELNELYEEYLDYYRTNAKLAERNPRQFWQQIAQDKRYYMNCDIDQMVWSYSVLVSVGKLMYEILIKELKINANLFRPAAKPRPVPAFLTLYSRNKIKLQEEIRSNVVFSKLFTEAQIDDIHFEASMLPMLVPPVPWTSPKRGGFLFTGVEIIRENLNEVSICRNKLKNQNLNAVYDALNAVSLCPWRINKPVSRSKAI